MKKEEETRLLGGEDLANLSPRDLGLLLSSIHEGDWKVLEFIWGGEKVRLETIGKTESPQPGEKEQK